MRKKLIDFYLDQFNMVWGECILIAIMYENVNNEEKLIVPFYTRTNELVYSEYDINLLKFTSLKVKTGLFNPEVIINL